jgi:hypothetical protein
MAATHAESSTGTMEALFRPTTRHRDIRGRLPGGCTAEVELLPGLTIENVLAMGGTWEDFCRFARRKMVWMTTHVYVYSQSMSGMGDALVLMLFNAARLNIYVVRGTAPAAATATCDFLLRLLATCDKRDLSIKGHNLVVPTPLSGAALSIFFRESRDGLRKVKLHDITFGEDHCRALATESRPTLKVIMSSCSLSDGGSDCQNAFVECLQNDRGPTELIMCRIDSRVLANALTGNSRVTKLQLDIHRTPTDDAGKGVVFRALANNKGLKELDLQNLPIDDENWNVLCESLKTHPSLISLDFRGTSPTLRTTRNELTEDQKAHRTRALAEMMKVNTVVHTIELSDGERARHIYMEEVLPYLETNRYRPRVLAISKADIQMRRPFLGLALQTESVRNDSNFLWMFLSRNADVVLQSDEDSDQVVEVSTASAPVEVAESVQVVVKKQLLSESVGVSLI